MCLALSVAMKLIMDGVTVAVDIPGKERLIYYSSVEIKPTKGNVVCGRRPGPFAPSISGPTPFPDFKIPDSSDFRSLSTSDQFRRYPNFKIENLLLVEQRWLPCEAKCGVIQSPILPILPLFHGNMLFLISVNVVEQLNC